MERTLTYDTPFSVKCSVHWARYPAVQFKVFAFAFDHDAENTYFLKHNYKISVDVKRNYK